MTALAPAPALVTQSDSVRDYLPSDAIGGDSESFLIIDRALQAPPTVCLQFGDTSGAHEVLITRKVRDGLFHMFDRKRSQIWLHNGMFDIGCFLEWYPELTELVWLALLEGRLFDTMYLQRMIQVARGEIGGPLALDKVTMQYGLRPPDKHTMTEHPDHPGVMVDVRTSFGLWYGAEEIPDPWHSYADYDGEIMLPLAARMVKRACIPTAPGRMPLVRLEDLAGVVRTYTGLALSRVYGLRVNPKAVSDLALAGRAALARLQEAAQINGFLKPAFASGKVRPDSSRPEDPKKAATWDKQQSRVRAHAAALAAGHRPPKVCPVLFESRPKGPPDSKKAQAWDRRAAKHRNCPGCRVQRLGADGAPQWCKNTTALKAAVTKAYEGKPPLTEPKKDKKTGKMTGGGQVATSRHVLQDSQNAELENWSEYNEWGALMSKDMAIFARGIVHTRIGIANTMRPTSSDPNILNFRRNSFFVGNCSHCGLETTLESGDLKKGKDTVVPCPNCQN